MKFKINPDKAFVEQIRKKIRQNNGYCPCQLKKDESTKCICKDFLDMPEVGWCHCSLYYKEEV